MALELSSVALFRTYIGDSAADSTLVTTFLNAAEQTIAKLCGRFHPGGAHWLTGSKTEYIDGEYAGSILLRWTPVTAVSTVNITTSATASVSVDTTLLEMDGIPIASLTSNLAGYVGRLGYRNNGFGSTRTWFDTGWPEPGLMTRAPNFGGGNARVVVAYTGGYAAAPDDLILAVNILANSYYKARTRDSTLKQETLGDYSYTLADNAASTSVPAEVEALIGPYRRILV